MSEELQNSPKALSEDEHEKVEEIISTRAKSPTLVLQEEVAK